MAIMARLEWLLLLTALTLAVLVYPPAPAKSLARGPCWDVAGVGRCVNLNLLSAFTIRPLCSRGWWPGVVMIAFVMVRLARLLIQPTLVGPARTEPAPAGRWAWLSVAALLGWILASAGWSPTPLLAREAALWVIIWGVFIFVLLRRGLSLAEMRQVGALMMLLGVPVLIIVFMEALPILFGQKIFLVMYHFEGLRNRYGSLLGHNIAASSFVMMTAFPCFRPFAGPRATA